MSFLEGYRLLVVGEGAAYIGMARALRLCDGDA